MTMVLSAEFWVLSACPAHSTQHTALSFSAAPAETYVENLWTVVDAFSKCVTTAEN